MALIRLETFINASPQTVFDLSRSVDLHKASMKHHAEEAVDGIKSGWMNKGDTVTWQATHLFKTRKLKVRITAMEPPLRFVDEMVEGDFKMMRHEHVFQPMNSGTMMTDRFLFASPFSIIGKAFDTLFLKRYMTRLLRERNTEIKRIAESSHQEKTST